MPIWATHPGSKHQFPTSKRYISKTVLWFGVCFLGRFVQNSVLMERTPYFDLKMVCIDCLHACDLGVTQDILGNVFYHALEHLFEAGSRLVAERADPPTYEQGCTPRGFPGAYCPMRAQPSQSQRAQSHATPSLEDCP